MLNKVDIQRFATDTASAAVYVPCWHSFEAKRQNGVVRALVGRYAR